MAARSAGKEGNDAGTSGLSHARLIRRGHVCLARRCVAKYSESIPRSGLLDMQLKRKGGATLHDAVAPERKRAVTVYCRHGSVSKHLAKLQLLEGGRRDLTQRFVLVGQARNGCVEAISAARFGHDGADAI